MYRKSSVLLLSVLLIVTLAACNLPSGAPPATEDTAINDLALTITAQAALLQPGSSDAQPTEEQQPPAEQFTATPELPAGPQDTATPSVPQVSVSTNTNCRTGPGTQYDLIDALTVGQTAEVVGKNSVTSYWIIKRPSGSGNCWLWGEYATVVGNTANLPEYPIPATPTPKATNTPTITPTFTSTPTPSIPAPVNNPVVAKVCIPLVAPNFQYTGTVTWEDQSNNETGFNIYLNGALFATIGANSVSYPIPPLPFAAGTPMKLGVEAYNSAGKSATKDVTFACP